MFKNKKHHYRQNIEKFKTCHVSAGNGYKLAAAELLGHFKYSSTYSNVLEEMNLEATQLCNPYRIWITENQKRIMSY